MFLCHVFLSLLLSLHRTEALAHSLTHSLFPFEGGALPPRVLPVPWSTVPFPQGVPDRQVGLGAEDRGLHLVFFVADPGAP
eukprot:3889459-Rhodomonas_salina.1